MLKKLRQTSIAGIIEEFQTRNDIINNNTTSIGEINGDVNTAGSILNAGLLSNTYADSVFGNIDLSQVEANRLAIVLLNADSSTEGSIAYDAATAIATAATVTDGLVGGLLTNIGVVTTGISDLNADALTPGSVAYTLAEIVDGAPENLNTLVEIADALIAEASVHVTMINSIADNKTANANALALHVAAYNTRTSSVDSAFIAQGTQTATDLQSAIDAFETASEGVYFQVANKLSEASVSAEKKAAFRASIGAQSQSELEVIGADKRFEFERKAFVVTAGSITLPVEVSEAYVDAIVIEYINDEFDELPVVPTVTPGVFTINDGVVGDLDAQTVYVKYNVRAA